MDLCFAWREENVDPLRSLEIGLARGAVDGRGTSERGLLDVEVGVFMASTSRDLLSTFENLRTLISSYFILFHEILSDFIFSRMLLVDPCPERA